MNREWGYREPAVAGYFYPKDPSVLKRRLEEFLEGDAGIAAPGPVGLICPHAGYDYSGPTAGHAYRELRRRPPEAVIVMGPSHYDRFRGASAWPGVGYRTPLGDVPHPEGILGALYGADVGIHADRLGHREEHSVEVQLPFLQEIAPGVPVLPLVLAEESADFCRRVGAALADAIGEKRIVLVASSDLYHGTSGRACLEADAITLGAIERNDPDELAGGFAEGRFQACGRGPILALLEACRRMGATEVDILARTNSDEVTGRAGGYVVGYGALAVRRA